MADDVVAMDAAPTAPVAAAAAAAAAASSGDAGSDTMVVDVRKGKGRASASDGDDGEDAFSQPWVEKYRPTEIEDVLGNEETLSRLRVIARDGNMPNLIISGPPGTGKTTSIMCLARALLGDAYKDGVMELNASDDRKIDTVRNQIKMFAQKKVTLPACRHKIIILDEADSMTKGAQQALRRTMEKFSSTTRFALACNESTKIIEPIQSRCAILRYTRLTDQQVVERLKYVIREEEVSYVKDGLEALVFTAAGDMRQALNNLQATVAGFSFVNADNVFKVCDQPHPKVVERIVLAACAFNVDLAVEELGRLWAQGYAPSDIVGTLFRVVKNFDADQIGGQYQQLEFIKVIGLAQLRLAEGVDSLLQLESVVAQMAATANPQLCQ